MKLRIGLLGAYGSSNLGNVAIESAAIQNLRDLASVDLLGICTRPDDAREALGIQAVLLSPPRSPAQSAPTSILGRLLNRARHELGRPSYHLELWRDAYRHTRGLDLLIISGGGQLDDFWGGSFTHPYALLRWVTAARLSGTPTAFASVGFSDLRFFLSRTFIRLAMRQSVYVSFRDERSLQTALRLKLLREDKALLVPDLAYSLEQAGRAPKPRVADEGFVVGIMPISRDAWRSADDSGYERYLEALVSVATRLLHAGHHVRLFSSDWMDSPLAADIRERVVDRACTEHAKQLKFTDTATLRSMFDELHGCDVVVASRLHSLLLAQSIRKPVVALAPFKKATQLMKDMGQARYCLALSESDPERVLALVEDARREARAIAKELDARILDYRGRLADQYRLLLSLARSGQSGSAAHLEAL